MTTIIDYAGNLNTPPGDIVDHGHLVGSASDGQWLKRRVASDVLARPVV